MVKSIAGIWQVYGTKAGSNGTQKIVVSRSTAWVMISKEKTRYYPISLSCLMSAFHLPIWA